jgi:hypothetical protein
LLPPQTNAVFPATPKSMVIFYRVEIAALYLVMICKYRARDLFFRRFFFLAGSFMTGWFATAFTASLSVAIVRT